jgi:flagellar motor protein MotB
MNTFSLCTLAGLGAATVFITGCTDGAPRELGYLRLQVMEQEDQIKYLKDSLQVAKNQKPGKEIIEKIVERNIETPPVIKTVYVTTPPTEPKPAQIDAKGVEVLTRDRDLVIEISGDILFASGSAKLDDKDKTLIKKVHDYIVKSYPKHEVRVEGHTDSEPVVRHKDEWDNNWDLSGGRARAVLEELQHLGIKGGQMYFAGFGEFHPVADNATPASRQNNRRVEVVIVDYKNTAPHTDRKEEHKKKK